MLCASAAMRGFPWTPPPQTHTAFDRAHHSRLLLFKKVGMGKVRAQILTSAVPHAEKVFIGYRIAPTLHSRFLRPRMQHGVIFLVILAWTNLLA